jgi:hypothetical protein
MGYRRPYVSLIRAHASLQGDPARIDRRRGVGVPGMGGNELAHAHVETSRQLLEVSQKNIARAQTEAEQMEALCMVLLERREPRS